MFIYLFIYFQIIFKWASLVSSFLPQGKGLNFFKKNIIIIFNFFFNGLA